MIRSISKMFLLVLSASGLFDTPLTADETIREDGSQVAEHQVSFERKQFAISRQKGKILFDGAEAPHRAVENKSKEVRLIEAFDGLVFTSEKQFHHWAQKLRGTRTYTYDEVTRVDENGVAFTQPLVFFDKDQRVELDKKWHVWLDKRQAEIEEANRARLAQENDAKLYQQRLNLHDVQAQTLTAQLAASERSAESLAVISGATSLWEVELIPAGYSSFCSNCSSGFSGFYIGIQSFGTSLQTNGSGLASTFDGNPSYDTGSNSIYVKSYGRNSQIASEQALNSNPGYRVGSIRKLAGF